MGGGDMEKLILAYVNSPFSAETNFALAEAYEKIQHYAGAATHFLKCTEYGDKKEDKPLIYESLLHLSLVMKNLGDRNYVEEGWLLSAITLCPERSEAYWMLSLLYERLNRWWECHTIASIGLQHKKGKLKIDIGFEDRYMLLFQKGVSAWHIGLASETRDIMFSLPEYSLNNVYKSAVQKNLSSIGSKWDPFLPYTKDKADHLRFKFNGCESIDKNYSQVYQDLFVLSILNGKREGYYLEIGSGDPFKGNNTYLLENSFDWKGVSIEIKEEEVRKFRENRKNPVVCKNALTTNYSTFLEGIDAPKEIDYLQLDCEPPESTYNILLSIPFEEYKFAVITFEHDFYADASRKYRELSRKFLTSQGYIMVVGNIAPDTKSAFEDWWVHPKLVNEKILQTMTIPNKDVVFASDYMFHINLKIN